jgi:hypothetical protein
MTDCRAIFGCLTDIYPEEDLALIEPSLDAGVLDEVGYSPHYFEATIEARFDGGYLDSIRVLEIFGVERHWFSEGLG